MDTCLSGRQVRVTDNDQRAVVEVGGGIRHCEVGDRSVFDPHRIDPICNGAYGAPPGRLVDGQYRFDDEHQLPTGAGAVDRTAYDFRESRLLGPTTLDVAFTDLVRDTDGRARARLRRTDGRRAELWVDESYRVMELYTGNTLAPQRRHKGRGAEPMTCPPNAFASGDALTRLEPGKSMTTTWGARLT